MPNSWSWRIPSLLQALVSVFQVIFIYWVPESPRWLIANGRTEEATSILSKHHCGTEEPTELVQLQVAEITAAIEFERSLESASYLQFFRTSRFQSLFVVLEVLLTLSLTEGNRHRLFIVVALGFIIQWCGNQLISSYLALVLADVGITDPETQNLINGCVQIFNFLVATAAATVVERFGRRPLFLCSTVGMLIVFTTWTALSARYQQQENSNKGLSAGIVAMVFIFGLFYNIAMNPLPIAYLLEVLPYTLRAKGLTAFNLAQYCSSMFNGFVNPVALEALRWKYYVVFVCALVLWFAIIFFTFPETRGMTLEEVSQIFDGARALERTYDIKADIEPAEAAHKEEVVVESKDK